MPKTSDPFPYNPVEFNHNEFSLINNLIPIWTDGLCCKSHNCTQTGWGVFFKEELPCNSSGSTSLSQNNFHAELEVIEFALSVAPNTHGLVIFTDSLSSMQLIQSKTVPRNYIEADFVLCISNLLKSREEDMQSVIFTHVYSHVQAKTKRASPLKLALMEAQRSALTRKFRDAEAIYKGNDQADVLAGDATLFEPRNFPFPHLHAHSFLAHTETQDHPSQSIM